MFVEVNLATRVLAKMASTRFRVSRGSECDGAKPKGRLSRTNPVVMTAMIPALPVRYARRGPIRKPLKRGAKINQIT